MEARGFGDLRASVLVAGSLVAAALQGDLSCNPLFCYVL